MKTKSLGLLLALLMSITSFAQEAAKSPSWNLSGAGFQLGVIVQPNQTTTLEDFQKQVNDPDFFQLNESFGPNTFQFQDDANFFNAMVELSKYQDLPHRWNHSWRFGLTYVNGDRRGVNFYQRVDRPLDTIATSSVLVTADSTFNHSVSFTEVIEEIGLFAERRFNTNRENRLSFSTGLALYGGIDIYSSIDRSDLNDTTIIFTVDNSTFTSFGDFDENRFAGASRTTGTNFFLRGYIPLALDFRLSLEDHFIGRCHLGYELKLGMEYHSAAGEGANVRRFTAHAVSIYYRLL